MKKGFTLIELLAVITILAIILLITFPMLSNTIRISKEQSHKDSINLYGRAIETAIADYYTENPETGSVTLEELENGGYLKYKGDKVECDEIQIVHRNVYLNDCKVGKKYVDYTYGKIIPVPELTQGLTPIEYDGDKWVVADSDSDDWYNYDKQRWANAVTLLPGITKNIGDEVKVDGSEASMMLVWIPRYEYKYVNLGNKYAGGTQMKPGEIKINFILSKRTSPSSNDYKIHPAFKFGDKNVSGFWVGKFELSSVGENILTENNLGCSQDTCISDISNIRILPNKPSLRYNDVSNFFYAIRGIEGINSFGLSNVDTHMIKNSEWGAVAYLSQSKYGKYANNDYNDSNKEIYRNLSNDFKTGNSNGAPFQDNAYEQCTYDQKIGTDTNQNKTNCGPGASTTGTIYGVYDMSGGSGEYVMGAYGQEYPTIRESGFLPADVFTSNTIASKYYDLYKTTNLDTACENNECYGHALSEINGWYGINLNNIDVSSTQPWIARGGNKETPGKNHILYSNFVSGKGENNVSSRFVGIVK